jgi:hypothetical protein
MSFDSFERAIDSPDLRKVAQHWREVCGSKRMPAWRDIRPTAISAQLPIVWSYKFDRASNVFTGRLAGDKIVAMFGKSFRGAAMVDLFPAHEYQTAFSRHKRVLTEPAFFRGTGVVFAHLEKYGVGERIILPLSDDGELGDGVIGATRYDSAAEASRDIIRAGEREQWFPLQAGSPNAA